MNENEDGKKVGGDGTIPFPGGSKGSGEKQGDKGDKGAAKSEQVEGPVMDVCVLVAIDENGRFGISTKPGIPAKRELTMKEVPGFLMQGAIEALEISMGENLEVKVRQIMIKMAMPPAPAPAPDPEDGKDAPPVDGEETPSDDTGEISPAPEAPGDPVASGDETPPDAPVDDTGEAPPGAGKTGDGVEGKLK